MLQRILEPEVMDSAEEATDYDSMDHSYVNRLFVSDLLPLRDDFRTLLDVGAGTAQIPIELCQRQAYVHVVAIDLAQHMLRVGQQNLEQTGLSERIHLQCCDAKRMPFADHSFDAVMSNSIVHHIPEPFAVFAQMARVVKPAACMFVRDLLRPVDDAALLAFRAKLCRRRQPPSTKNVRRFAARGPDAGRGASHGDDARFRPEHGPANERSALDVGCLQAACGLAFAWRRANAQPRAGQWKPFSASQRSASSAAMHPVPAAVTAWR